MIHLAFLLALGAVPAAPPPQWVEGFDQVVFHHHANGDVPTRDFRGMAAGYMTAAWWAPGQMRENFVVWKTAPAPEARATTFVFIGASSPLPPEYSRGPRARLSVNGREAVTFTLGCPRDFTWREGPCVLQYESKRVEFASFGSHRQTELNGDSGRYRLSVPAAWLTAGRPAELKVEILPFAGWHAGWFMVKARRDALAETVTTLEGELEAVRADVARLGEQTDILAANEYRAQLGGLKFTHEVIYQDGFRHLHPADLIRLRNGDLLLMAREATEHYAPDGDVIMLRSRDGGVTWGEKQVIAGRPELDEREGCGVQLPDGTIVVGIFYNANYNPDGSYRVKDHTPGKRYLGTYIITSKDDGHTWSAPNFLSTEGMPFAATEGPTDAPIVLPDGSLLMAVIGYRLQGDPQNTGSVMLRSTDRGAHWNYLSTIAGDPGGKAGGFVEPGIVRLRSGRIVAGLRTPASDQAIYFAHSDDDGRTWTAPAASELHGHPVDLVQLADGRVMATYGVRPPIHAVPGGIRAAFSRDGGVTWDPAGEVRLRDDFLNWDIGYPESLPLADGRILTVYYYNLFGRYFLGGTFWRPDPPADASD